MSFSFRQHVSTPAATKHIDSTEAAMALGLSLFQPTTTCPLNAAPAVDFLSDMKRRNEQDSDHRNIMTPEFRAFCVSVREHVICGSVLLTFFILSYIAVRRACAAQIHRRGRSKQYVTTPYSAVLRARQIPQILASIGLASAGMLAMLMAVTVALSNVMDFGDPRHLATWRTWLLPHTLLVPGERQTDSLVNGSWTGPQGAHDFPPVLRRLWLYQSSVSIASSVFLLPMGVLFEGTSQRMPVLRRILIAFVRWLAASSLLLGIWTLLCARSSYLYGLGLYQPFAADAATIRYSVYYAACVFVALPTVLLVAPRGTWALFSWLKCCVGQTHEMTHRTMQRYAQLKGEQQRLESCLKETISSWKWEQLRDSEDADIVENNSSNGNDSDGDEMLDFEALPAKKNRSGVQISRCAPVGLPPPRPLLHPTAGSQPRLGFNSLRSRITGSKRRPVLEDSLTPPSSRGSPTMRSSSADRLETSSLRSSSSFIRLASYIAEQADIADIGLAGINMVRAVRGARRKRAMEREREMQRLAKLIRKYHAQLVFVQGELARIDESGVLANGSRKGVPRSKRSAKHIMMDMVRNASAVLLTALANLCWLLVVLQIARGALSALFVGEPDLTQRFTYFLPALSMAGGIEGRNKSAKGRLPAQLALPRTQLAMPPLITVCQVVSSGLLFAVVMFGILSFGSSVEESVHPLRFLISSYISRLLRARQWDWLPHILLSSDVLAAINPVTDSSVSPMAKHVEIPSKMVGRTSRIFYSSSSDLTSFYRGVQRESLAYYPVTSMGALSDSVLQARAWGRRVFLLWAQRRTPVTSKQLLAYVWIVTCLAMTWPGVLRTTGLISERAYLLPTASLVQPLWTKYSNEEPVMLHPVHSLECAHGREVAVESRMDSDGVMGQCGDGERGEKCGMATPEVAHRVVAMDLPSGPASVATAGVVPTDTQGTDQPRQKQLQQQPSAMRTVTRRSLVKTLTSETPLRLAVKWLLELLHSCSPHSSVAIGAAIWVSFPDLIVPLTPTTIDLQLGFLPQMSTVEVPQFTFGVPPQLSEWYAMLVRVELGSNSGLPQDTEGTPYMVQRWMPVAGKQRRLRGGTRLSGTAKILRALINGIATMAAQVVWIARIGGAWLAACVRDTAVTSVLQMYRDFWSLLIGPAVPYLQTAWSGVWSGMQWLGDLLMSGVLDSSFASQPMAITGAGSMVPAVFLPVYWATLTSNKGPAVQRLRPELWPHAFLGSNNYIYLDDPLGRLAAMDTPKPHGTLQKHYRRWDGTQTNGVLTDIIPADPVDSSPATEPIEQQQLKPAVLPQAPTAESEVPEGAVVARPVRKVWTAFDWILAIYRVALGVLAGRAMFARSGQVSILSL